MKFPTTLFGVTLFLVSSTGAGITTYNPYESVTWNGGEKETITWVDDRKVPTLNKIGEVTIELMAGGPENQHVVTNIGKALATAKTFTYTVPKDVGPPGNFYFIKYTTESYFAFSGRFSIEGVNGNIEGFDPKTPNVKSPVNNITTTTISSTSSYLTPSQTGASQNSSPSETKNPGDKSNDSVPKKSSPDDDQANDASSFLPSFLGITTSAFALTLTYLY
ncbi:10496_t:CDS:1 [Funneliformis geosporum]|uniref:15996_t:CDS:1 n=1 Tax=Funneliformis geosporum TaxID=1117311 RepID=A0A9W4SKT9_9GLOM|nr:15996_t:CDS:1 [Funneliformis geosporum]CAI2175402.1 10496_t:CDS:1 [Funneliformis geosporum]